MKTPFRGFSAILYKEFLVVLRDPMTLFFMFFPPLIQMIAFGYRAGHGREAHLPTVVLDEDRTLESRQLVDQFVNTQTFRVRGRSAQQSGGAVADDPPRQGLRRAADSARIHARPARRAARRACRC